MLRLSMFFDKFHLMPKRKEIEMCGSLPRWKKDDVAFVCSVLAKHPENLNITELVRELGFSDRLPNDSESHTSEYMRMRAALRGAEKRGLVMREGRKWGLVVLPQARAS